MSKSIHFHGLNSLRFYAAFLVIIYHIQKVLIRNDFISFLQTPILNKSDEAVSFFFTLSGFLIT
ncbi:MAG: hypothetical protein U9R42_05690 [Bacteroidota bacterium]|nr:hypothetical protein [Bacteroidota bacterium]